ncbi:MAG TPA: hypothetical protein EYG97_01130 [Arcobacter sp.]|nr:hypothetical protein [Arcobacter sp.]
MEKEHLQTKQELIDEMKLLIDNSEHKVEINIKYIDYFEIDELIEMRDMMKYKKENRTEETSDYLDDIFSRCSE